MRKSAVFFLACILAMIPAAARAGDIGLGTLVGAGLGALVGNQIGHGTGKIAATAVGAFTGGVIGHHTVDRSWHGRHDGYARGGYVDYYTPQRVVYTPNYVAPPAPPVQIVYARPYYDAPVYAESAYAPPPIETSYDDTPPDYCREYTQRIQIGSQVQESYGTACQQPDGSWKIVK